MANTHTTLTSLFSDMADAIREKSGSTATIVADNFPTEIRNIKGGCPNGTEWTRVSNMNMSGNGTVLNIAYGNGVWVCCGYIIGTDGNYYGTAYSYDGKNWVGNSSVSDHMYSLCYGKGVFVMGADNGIYYSADGINWTFSSVASNTDFGSKHAIKYADGMFLAIDVYYRGSDGIYYSTDGINWTLSPVGAGGANSSNNTLCHANGMWVYSTYEKGVFYSIDGINWTQSNLVDTYIGNIFYGDGLWLTKSYHSNDGKTWTANTTTNKTIISYANGKWFGYTKPALYYSNDGMTWIATNITSNAPSRAYNVYYECGVYTAAYRTYTYYSFDGITWIQANNVSLNSSLNDLEYIKNINNIWFAVWESGEFYYSVTWEKSS